MFSNATEGLIPYVEQQTKYSSLFKNFLEICLQMDPEKRPTPQELLSVRN